MKPYNCVFCTRVENREYSSTSHPEVVSFEPLNPVVPGHMLFIPKIHLFDASEAPEITGLVFAAASQYANERHEHFNLITSAGVYATQSVFHLHVHYVPRNLDDGLPLPWTPQQEDCPLKKCRWTHGDQCETHYSGCPDHDCDWCNPPAFDGEGS